MASAHADLLKDHEHFGIHPPLDQGVLGSGLDGGVSAGRHRGPDSAETEHRLEHWTIATTGHPKKQAEIIRAFGDLTALQQSGWRHHSIGALSASPADVAYFADLQAMAGSSTSLLTNVTRATVKEQLAHAKLFVHAAGFGEPADKPEAAEHFGIATVEAMAAGAVPIVVNRGAQPEIVEHGVSGFVWNTREELQNYIIVLAKDDALLRRMADAARLRAEKFSRQNFLSRMEALLPSER